MKRSVKLDLARIAGYHGDNRTWTHLRIEGGVSLPALREAWDAGVRAKVAGQRCECLDCKDAADRKRKGIA